MVGSSHNIVRHPDMPAAAFEDLWSTIKSGKPWSGLVKNRCKNGDYYWVLANVTPVREGGEVTGYLSVRTRPTDDQISEADARYKAINANGKVPGPGMVDRILGVARSITIRTWMAIYAVGVMAMLSIFTWLGYQQVSPSILVASLGAISVSLAICAFIFNRYINAPVEQAVKTLAQLADGHFSDWIEVDRDDEFGLVLQYLKSAQISLGFEINENQVMNYRMQRIMEALDRVHANVMLTDPDNNILYLNESMHNMMAKVQGSLHGTDTFKFDIDETISKSMDLFYSNSAFKDFLGNQTTDAKVLETQIGSCHVRVKANPVTSAEGKNIGSVLEWEDCFQEVVVEKEIERIIKAALAGDLSQRLDNSEMEGFFRFFTESMNKLISIFSDVIDDTIITISSMAKGDLTKKIDGDYHGSYGQLKADVNNTIEKMKEVMGEITNSSSTVLQGSHEIAEGNKHLSQRTESQAANLEETAASMEEMTSQVRQNADHAREANQLAETARTQAEQGGDVVNQAIRAMGDITDSSNRIAAIISVIDEIAFQTNLLALNASVEAARAGDQGRGFAVVASEVRNLAGRSATAAKEIKELIDDSVIKVGEGAKLVDESGQTLETIVEAVNSVSDIIAGIAGSSQEQREGIEQVNRAISKMDEMTQQNAALVEEAAASSESMGDHARKLNQLVAFFKSKPVNRLHSNSSGSLDLSVSHKMPLQKMDQRDAAGTPNDQIKTTDQVKQVSVRAGLARRRTSQKRSPMVGYRCYYVSD